jgi:3-keto-disaccharide hydrolase
MRPCFILILCTTAAAGQDSPPVVDARALPSDAVSLFDGTTMNGWVNADGQPARCGATRGIMTCTAGTGNIFTEKQIGSAQIHLEFKVPYMPDEHDQGRGNSGVYLQGRYEIQILDSFETPTYSVGMAGALYGQAAPLVNAARPPGEWQTYDIIFHAPRCSESGELLQPATVTLFWNRVLALDHVSIDASTCTSTPGPLMLQDHNATRMQFRNLWYRSLDQQ